MHDKDACDLFTGVPTGHQENLKHSLENIKQTILNINIMGGNQFKNWVSNHKFESILNMAPLKYNQGVYKFIKILNF